MLKFNPFICREGGIFFMRVHLMGLAGAGMSALAKLLQAEGHEVTGCDVKEPSYYHAENITHEKGHSPEHIKKYNPEILICSSAIDQECDEVVFAKNLSIPIFSRGLSLSMLFNSKNGIGIAGAHGKSTTTSMTGLIFSRAGLNPTIYIGANVPDLGSNAIPGEGKIFIAELDESDGSFEFFTPSTTIITNADWDHVDHFPTRGDFVRAFIRFANGRKSGSPLIICAEDEGSSQVIESCDKNIGPIIRYGFGKSLEWGAYEIENISHGGIKCKISHEGSEIGELNLNVSGEHNILNALASIAAAYENDIDFESSVEILRTFHGSERRMQIKGEYNEIIIMDDYAHHPSEMRATLNAVKAIYPDKRIILIYQPHRFTRTAKFLKETAQGLSLADVAYLMPVYSAGENEISGVSSDEIINLGKNINSINFDNAINILSQVVKRGDLVLTMGAGDVYKIGELFLKHLQYEV